jgi:hypothetical protein
VGVLGSPGREDAVDAQRDQLVQGGVEIAGLVESAVEGDRQRPCGGEEAPDGGAIDRALGRQRSEDDPGDAEPAQAADLSFHGRELSGSEHEASRARSDHDMNGEARPFQRGDHELARGREAPEVEARAELDAPGAAFLGGTEAREGIDADFKERGQRHAATLPEARRAG